MNNHESELRKKDFIIKQLTDQNRELKLELEKLKKISRIINIENGVIHSQKKVMNF